jgi:hypothetical protein
LETACVWHTEEKHHTDPTIGTCWDADRLDLGRVGMIPNARFMSTAFGKEIADHGVIHPWLHLAEACLEENVTLHEGTNLARGHKPCTRAQKNATAMTLCRNQ